MSNGKYIVESAQVEPGSPLSEVRVWWVARDGSRERCLHNAVDSHGAKILTVSEGATHFSGREAAREAREIAERLTARGYAVTLDV